MLHQGRTGHRHHDAFGAERWRNRQTMKNIRPGPRNRARQARQHAYDADGGLQQMVDKVTRGKADDFGSAAIQAIEVILVLGSSLDQGTNELTLPNYRT